MPPEDGTGTVGGQSIAVPEEFNSENQQLQVTPANIQWSVQDPSIANVSTDPATGNGVFTDLAAGETGVTVTDTVAGVSMNGTLTISIDSKVARIDIAWQNGTQSSSSAPAASATKK